MYHWESGPVCETCGVRARVLVKLYSDISVILGGLGGVRSGGGGGGGRGAETKEERERAWTIQICTNLVTYPM